MVSVSPPPPLHRFLVPEGRGLMETSQLGLSSPKSHSLYSVQLWVSLYVSPQLIEGGYLVRAEQKTDL